MRAFQQLSARTQTGEWADGTSRFQMGIFHHAVRADFAVVTDSGVFNHAARADFNAMAQYHVAFKDNVSINFDIAPMRQGATQVKTRRVAQHYACQQQFFCLFGLINAFKAGKLQTVIHAVSFTDTRRVNRGNLTTFVVCHGDNIGDIELALRIVIVELRQPALQIRAVSNQDTGVDLLNLTLCVGGIFVLNDAGHFAVLTGNTTITAWIVQHHRQQANSALRLGFTQALQRFNGDQRHVAVEHQNIFVIREERRSLLHRMTGAQLFSLQHPVQVVIG